MRQIPLSFFFFGAFCLLSLFVAPCESQIPDTYSNLAVGWVRQQLKLIQQITSFFSPPGCARALAMLSCSMRDAASFYVPNWNVMLPTLKDLPKRPKSEQTEKNINIAISYTAYRIIKTTFVDNPQLLPPIDRFFVGLGLDPALTTEDPSSPIGIGNLVARLMIEDRMQDGSNQNGSNPRGLTNKPYSPWVNYFPVNDPQPTPKKTDCSKIRNLNHWQPLRVPTKAGGVTVQSFSAPHAFEIKPFSLPNSAYFRSLFKGPALLGTSTEDQFKREFGDVLRLSGSLDDASKAVSEFWADGPDSTLPPGHWQAITAHLAEERSLNLIQSLDVLMLQSVAACDAGLVIWELKRLWDSVRPITAIQCLFANQTVTAWKGPYQGVGTISGGDWVPYQNPFFVTPPFAEYPSGHSGFSFASATVLRKYFGSDRLDYQYTIKKGSSLYEPLIPAGKPGYIAGVTDVPNSGPNSIGYSPANDVVLSFPTLTAAAESAGLSRRIGGIHVETGDLDGRRAGALVGEAVWEKYRSELLVSSPPEPAKPPPSVSININFNGLLGN